MKSIILQNNKLVKTAALITILSMLLWVVGLNNARGAGITIYSDTLSDSAPSAGAQHSIAYTSATAAAAGETIFFGFSDNWDLSVGFTDADVSATGMTVVNACAAGTDEVTVTSSDIGGSKGITLTVCAGESVPAGAITVTIGDGAAGGINDIVNPSAAGSEEITLGGTQTDSGATRVFVIDNIAMTATVDTVLNFWIIARTTAVTAANGEAGNNDITTTATTIPWGNINSTAPYVASHDLSVETNATNGFTVTLEQDQNMTSSASDDIDLFIDGAATASPVAWAAPTGTLAFGEAGYGHYGITSADTTLIGGDDFGSALYAGNIATAREVFYNNGPGDGDASSSAGAGTADDGVTQVGYKMEISGLQEAGDYSNTLTYIATPIF